MKNFFLKKIVSGILIVSIVIPMVICAIPQKAEAQWATFDAANVYQNTLTAINTTGSAFADYSLELFHYVLNTIATTLAKQMIRSLTASVVNWINSGFEGSPSFVTNPGSFFLDVADQISGEFLATCGSFVDEKQPDGTTKRVCSGLPGPLSNLCSPFSIDIRIALAFKYRPFVAERYSCTLSKIIKNSANAVEGATINGFTAGDFKQGGWPAFVSLTTEPQNNIYGAYLRADADLAYRVANAQDAKKTEISNGQGFLSWRNPKCKAEVKAHNAALKKAPEDPEAEGYTGDVSETYPRSVNDCPIETPGSMIAGSLENSLKGPLRELELVDSINEIVNALVAQLVTTVLQGGLKSVSGSGASDSSSYLYQIQREANNGGIYVNETKTKLLENLNTYLNYAFQYKNNKDQSLNTILNVKGIYDSAKKCYGDKIVSNQPPLTPDQIQAGQAQISAIDSQLTANVNPLATQLLNDATTADARYKTLNDIKIKAEAAKTLNELNAPSQEYSQLLQARSLLSPLDVQASQAQLTQTQATAAPLLQDAQRKLQACQLFPNSMNGF